MSRRCGDRTATAVSPPAVNSSASRRVRMGRRMVHQSCRTNSVTMARCVRPTRGASVSLLSCRTSGAVAAALVGLAATLADRGYRLPLSRLPPPDVALSSGFAAGAHRRPSCRCVAAFPPLAPDSSDTAQLTTSLAVTRCSGAVPGR